MIAAQTNAARNHRARFSGARAPRSRSATPAQLGGSAPLPLPEPARFFEHKSFDFLALPRTPASGRVVLSRGVGPTEHPVSHRHGASSARRSRPLSSIKKGAEVREFADTIAPVWPGFRVGARGDMPGTARGARGAACSVRPRTFQRREGARRGTGPTAP